MHPYDLGVSGFARPSYDDMRSSSSFSGKAALLNKYLSELDRVLSTNPLVGVLESKKTNSAFMCEDLLRAMTPVLGRPIRPDRTGLRGRQLGGKPAEVTQHLTLQFPSVMWSLLAFRSLFCFFWPTNAAFITTVSRN